MLRAPLGLLVVTTLFASGAIGCGDAAAPPPKAPHTPLSSVIRADAGPPAPGIVKPAGVAGASGAVKLRARPNVWVKVSGPRMAPFQKSAVGVGGYHATLRFTNAGTAPAELDGLVVAFTASREGVSFPCREHVGGQPRVRETKLLAPGETATFERDIDCATTLLGRYLVSASVGFGAAATLESAGTFELEVVGSGSMVPRPYPGRPALHVALVGEALVKAMNDAAWREGAYAPVVVLTNASPEPILLGAVRVVLTMRGAGGALVRCEREGTKAAGVDVWRNAPYSLDPGASQVVSVPMRCGPPAEGDYTVQGFVVLGDGPYEEGAPVGPLPIKITSDPALTVPPVDVPTTEEERRRRGQ